MHCARRLLAALACVAACHAAHADRSRVAEDGDAAEAGDCELDLAFERQTARGTAAERERSMQLDCGIGWRTELVVALARGRSEDGRREAIDLEARTSVFERGAGGLSWALEYGLSVERIGGGHWRRSEYFVALDAAFAPVPAWVIEARLGSARDLIERRDRTLWTLGVEHEISDALEARAELDGDDRERPLASVELHYEFWPDVARINLSYGARSGPLRERRVGVGVTFEF